MINKNLSFFFASLDTRLLGRNCLISTPNELNFVFTSFLLSEIFFCFLQSKFLFFTNQSLQANTITVNLDKNPSYKN